jgi:hypothetical protein
MHLSKWIFAEVFPHSKNSNPPFKSLPLFGLTTMNLAD